MAEPPSKRARRTDGASMREESDRRGGQSARSGREQPPFRDHRRPRQRDYNDQRNDRHSTNGDGYYHKGRERSNSRERKRGPRDSRMISRSPIRDGQRRSSPRQLSPPRGPRSASGRGRHHTDMEWAPSAPTSSKDKTVKEPRGKVLDDTKNSGSGNLHDDDEDDAEAKMTKMLGFCKFKSTKNTKVAGNDKLYAVRKDKKTEYRQYMNRTGGFNRPLSPSR